MNVCSIIQKVVLSIKGASLLLWRLFVQQSPTLLFKSQWHPRTVYSVYTQYSVGCQPCRQWGTCLYHFFMFLSDLHLMKWINNKEKKEESVGEKKDCLCCQCSICSRIIVFSNTSSSVSECCEKWGIFWKAKMILKGLQQAAQFLLGECWGHYKYLSRFWIRKKEKLALNSW